MNVFHPILVLLFVATAKASKFTIRCGCSNFYLFCVKTGAVPRKKFCRLSLLPTRSELGSLTIFNNLEAEGPILPSGVVHGKP